MAYIDKMHDLTLALGEVMERNTGHLDEDFAPKESAIFLKVEELAKILRESKEFNGRYEHAKSVQRREEQREENEKEWILEQINDLVVRLDRL